MALTPYFIHTCPTVPRVWGAPPPGSPGSRNTLRVAHEARACGGNWRTGGEGRGGRGGRVSGIRVGTPEELSHQCPHTPLPRGSEVRRPKPTLCDRTNTLETSSSRYFLMGHTDLSKINWFCDVGPTGAQGWVGARQGGRILQLHTRTLSVRTPCSIQSPTASL